MSLSTSLMTDTATSKPSSAADEQGIRAFLYNLLNSQHLFTQTDIVDQIEAFIQIKIDRCNQMTDVLRERLIKSQAETKRALAAQHNFSSDKNRIQQIFEECLEQLRADKKTEAERKVYNNPRLLDESRTERSTKSPSAFSKKHARIPPAARRLQSGTISSQMRTQKLKLRNSQPRKGIYAAHARETKPSSVVDTTRNKQIDRTADDSASSISRTIVAQDLIYNQPLVGPKSTRNEKTRNSAAVQHHFRTHTLTMDAGDREKGYNSLGNISLGPISNEVTTLPRESLKAHDKRALIDSFLKNEEVFKLLYETVFSPTSASAG